MKKRVGVILLAVCLLAGALLGAGFGLRGSQDGPDVSLEDMTADLTPKEEKRYAAYLNLASENGLEVHFWRKDDQTVGTIRAMTSVDGKLPPVEELRADPLSLVLMRKILRRYPGATVRVRSAEELTAEQLNEAKGICVIY